MVLACFMFLILKAKIKGLGDAHMETHSRLEIKIL